MSTLKVANIRDLSGTGGFYLNSGTISAQGTLTVSNLVINGTISGTNTQYLPSQSGNTGKYLTTDGANSSWATLSLDAGPVSMQVFTGTGTWTKPANIKYIRVQVLAGGGGGSGHGESGGAGGYSEVYVNVTSVSSVGVTVGGGGGGTYYAGGGGTGGASSFGGYASAQPGHGANQQHQHCGGRAGVGSGGSLNIHGGGGQGHEHYGGGGDGGASYFGGSGPSGHPQGGNYSHNHQAHSAPGTGGSSGWQSGHRGADGKAGMVVITEYK